MKRILIVWGGHWEKRNTILDHLYSFKKYDQTNRYYYLRIEKYTDIRDLAWIKDGMFDAIIWHYTFLSMRTTDDWEYLVELNQSIFEDISSKKVLLPQDDYVYTGRIWEFIKRIKIDKVYTIIRREDYNEVYPQEKVGDVGIQTVFTGYVDEKYRRIPQSPKGIDLFYRARKLPFSLGELGQKKYELVELFTENSAGLDVDLANTIDDRRDTLTGNKWIEALANSRCTIGCLGGSSVLDADGGIDRAYKEYIINHPEATYSEAKDALFKGMKEPLHGMISPRIFEAAAVRTCQVLIGRDYQGVLIPDEDYIVLEDDYSNLDEVVKRIRDVDYCRRIAENCYKHVVEDEKYSYKEFVRSIVDDIPEIHGEKNKKGIFSSIIILGVKMFLRESRMQFIRHIKRTGKSITNMKYRQRGR